MNAKKIMGAVLVALLAAALFVGAGAAADAEDKGTLFTYVDLSALVAVGDTFTAEDGSFVTAETLAGLSKAGFAVSENQIAVGKTYSGYSSTLGKAIQFKLSAPTALVTAVNEKSASIIDGTIAIGEKVTFGLAYNTSVLGTASYVFISPDGVETKTFGGMNPSSQITLGQTIKAGKWGVKADFSNSANLATGAPKYGQTYYFTVTDSATSITANKDVVIDDNDVIITVVAPKLTKVTVKFDANYLELIGDQIGVDYSTKVINGANSEVEIAIGASGAGKLAFTAKKDGSTTIIADEISKEVTITIEKGTLTAEAGAPAYYLGDDVVISGTSTSKDNIKFYMKGPNHAWSVATSEIATVNADGTWEVKFVVKDVDAATYTFRAVSGTQPAGSAPFADAAFDDLTYADVQIRMTQPFITATAASTVVAIGDDIVVTGTAEATNSVHAYVFGTNFFVNATATTKSDDTYKLEIPTNGLDAGQYFIVVQHPMYDGDFNILDILVGTQYKIFLNSSAEVTGGAGDTFLTNIDLRQTANAAEALCQALDTQNIDDLYVKLSVILEAKSMTMNAVSDVTKGSKLVVSGTSNTPGETVIVDMLSTAFAAVPKEAVGSASYITLSTTVKEDGTWEVTFDTSSLDIDEYTISAAIGNLAQTTVVKVVEGAPVTPEQPDTPVTPEQPEQPEQPTEPETPGFGALAALAGLGAVAVLLLRRE